VRVLARSPVQRCREAYGSQDPTGTGRERRAGRLASLLSSLRCPSVRFADSHPGDESPELAGFQPRSAVTAEGREGLGAPPHLLDYAMIRVGSRGASCGR
jgi:hypothetical protein